MFFVLFLACVYLIIPILTIGFILFHVAAFF